jgi:DNA-binding response OmpR family regulator
MPGATIDLRNPDCASGLVLVLCTDPDLSVRIVHWLGQGSFKLVQAFDGYYASRLIEQDDVAAIVTDRLLPPWPGLDAFALLRKSQPRLAIIYAGNRDIDNGSLARAAGATHVLSNPLRRQAVLNALPQWLVAA